MLRSVFAIANHEERGNTLVEGASIFKAPAERNELMAGRVYWGIAPLGLFKHIP